MGLMVDNAALVPELIIMVSNLRGAQDFRLLETPVNIAGYINRLELKSATSKGETTDQIWKWQRKHNHQQK